MFKKLLLFIVLVISITVLSSCSQRDIICDHECVVGNQKVGVKFTTQVESSNETVVPMSTKTTVKPRMIKYRFVSGDEVITDSIAEGKPLYVELSVGKKYTYKFYHSTLIDSLNVSHIVDEHVYSANGEITPTENAITKQITLTRVIGKFTAIKGKVPGDAVMNICYKNVDKEQWTSGVLLSNYDLNWKGRVALTGATTEMSFLSYPTTVQVYVEIVKGEHVIKHGYYTYEIIANKNRKVTYNINHVNPGEGNEGGDVTSPDDFNIEIDEDWIEDIDGENQQVGKP